jgi:hypothetical protein
MEERGRLGTQSDSIDQDLGPGRCGPYRRGAGSSLHHRVLGVHPLAGEHHGTVRGRPYDCLTGGDDVPLAVDFEMDHRLIPRKIEWRNVPADL